MADNFEHLVSLLQCNPDIRELSGPENTSLISRFGLFCLGNTGSNLGPEKISLISGFLLYPGFSYIRVTLYFWCKMDQLIWFILKWIKYTIHCVNYLLKTSLLMFHLTVPEIWQSSTFLSSASHRFSFTCNRPSCTMGLYPPVDSSLDSAEACYSTFCFRVSISFLLNGLIKRNFRKAFELL